MTTLLASHQGRAPVAPARDPLQQLTEVALPRSRRVHDVVDLHALARGVVLTQCRHDCAPDMNIDGDVLSTARKLEEKTGTTWWSAAEAPCAIWTALETLKDVCCYFCWGRRVRLWVFPEVGTRAEGR